MSSVYQAKTSLKSEAGLMNTILQTVTRWKPIIHLSVIKNAHPNQNSWVRKLKLPLIVIMNDVLFSIAFKFEG